MKALLKHTHTHTHARAHIMIGMLRLIVLFFMKDRCKNFHKLFVRVWANAGLEKLRRISTKYRSDHSRSWCLGM